MSLTLRDRQLSAIYTSLQSKLATEPDTEIGDANLVDVLAAVGDRSGANAQAIAQALQGLAKPEQLALVKKGLAKTEKKDLADVLDKGEVPLSKSARNFLAALLDREPLQNDLPPLDLDLAIDPSQQNGLSGTAKAGWVVEAINLSTSPTGRLHTDDVIKIATADASGHFAGAFVGQLANTQQGDVIRVRTRNEATGETTNFIDIRANGLGQADTRNAQLAVFRIGLQAQADGTVNVANINDSRQISEPGAVVQFKNERTGETTRVTLDKEGTFAPDLKLNGKPGDVFVVATSDGINNSDFSAVSGKVTVPIESNNGNTIDLPDPKLHRDELNADGTPKFTKVRFEGPLFSNNVSVVDVRQGQIGDCYCPAAVAAVAQADPSKLRDMIVQNADKTYTVTFKERTRNGFRDVRVTVDGDLYVRPWGGPLYGGTDGSSDPKQMEMWWPIFEKAYASWKGSYDAIGNGGAASDVMECIMGEEGYDTWIDESRTTQTWDAIRKAIDNHAPAALGTYGESQDKRYVGTGVYSDHAYSVLGYKVDANGEKMVHLRNPWGESAPNEEHDGIFWMKLEDVCHLYQTFYTVR